jgi:hypothetical protein
MESELDMVISLNDTEAAVREKHRANGCGGCYFHSPSHETETDCGCMSSGKCVYEPEEDE